MKMVRFESVPNREVGVLLRQILAIALGVQALKQTTPSNLLETQSKELLILDSSIGNLMYTNPLMVFCLLSMMMRLNQMGK